jgi:hypothetical protein
MALRPSFCIGTLVVFFAVFAIPDRLLHPPDSTPSYHGPSIGRDCRHHALEDKKHEFLGWRPRHEGDPAESTLRPD